MSRYLSQTLLIAAFIGLLGAPVELARRIFRRQWHSTIDRPDRIAVQ